MSKRHNKSRKNVNSTVEKIVLATAIINLIDKLLDIIDRLLE